MLTSVLRELLEGRRPDRERSRAVLDAILTEDPPQPPIAALLALIQQDGPRGAEIAGFADSLAAAAVPFPDPPGDGIDTCGTGGDGKGTFNLSTTAALVAAAAGARVYKHGNRAATSHSGSADLLEAWGVPVESSPQESARRARDHGFTFLYARQYHPVLAKLAPIRAALGFPTIFNLLGPLLNPARVRRQVIGVYSPAGQDRVAEALALRGVERCFVLHGAGGLDEATPLGPFRLLEVCGHEVRPAVERDPAELGLARCELADLQVDGAEASRGRAEEVLRGDRGPCRDAVVLSTALALEIAGVAADWREGAERAATALDSGAAAQLLDRLRAESNR